MKNNESCASFSSDDTISEAHHKQEMKNRRVNLIKDIDEIEKLKQQLIEENALEYLRNALLQDIDKLCTVYTSTELKRMNDKGVLSLNRTKVDYMNKMKNFKKLLDR